MRRGKVAKPFPGGHHPRKPDLAEALPCLFASAPSDPAGIRHVPFSHAPPASPSVSIPRRPARRCFPVTQLQFLINRVTHLFLTPVPPRPWGPWGTRCPGTPQLGAELPRARCLGWVGACRHRGVSAARCVWWLSQKPNRHPNSCGLWQDLSTSGCLTEPGECVELAGLFPAASSPVCGAGLGNDSRG